MNFNPILNPLIILIYILIMFVISIDCSWEFDNDDGFWGAPQPHSQGNTNLDYSGIFNTENTGASSTSRPSDSAWSSKTLSENPTLNEMEAAFWAMYKNDTKWPFIYSDKGVLQDACAAAWNVSTTTHKCAGAPSPSDDQRYVKSVGRPLLRVELLICKCVPHNTGRKGFMSTRFRYLARYNNSRVFILTNPGPVNSHQLRIEGMGNVQNS